jgi:hypothetical protein
MTDSLRAIQPVLLGGFDYVWDRLRTRLHGISADEYRWEPVPDCWTVRPTGETWEVTGAGRAPEPAPITTIAWRTWHIASDCLATYLANSPAGRPLEVTDREWFGEPEPALAAMDTAYAAFRQLVVDLGEDGMWEPLGPTWGSYADDPWADLVVHAFDEVVHHGAEIGLLRDLYLRMA